MQLIDALLDAWDRQAKIVLDVAGLVTDETRSLRPAPDGMTLDLILAHVHGTRKYWLMQADEARGKELPTAYKVPWQSAIDSLEEIKATLSLSAAAVRASLVDVLENEVGPMGPYENPVLFLEHMIWHEGWHVGQIMAALRQAGLEPPEQWEEPHLWEPWRGVEVWED